MPKEAKRIQKNALHYIYIYIKGEPGGTGCAVSLSLYIGEPGEPGEPGKLYDTIIIRR
jgi:hypothetical protein